MKSLWIACAAIVVASGSMWADTISSTGTLSAFPSSFTGGTPVWINNTTSPGPPTGGTPFWNDASDDTGLGGSHLMNIGYALTGTGGFASSILPSGETMAGATDLTNGGADVGFNFVRNATSYNIVLLFASSGVNTGAAAGPTTGTTFGYFYYGSPEIALYNVANTATATGLQSFNPTTAGNVWGFYSKVCYDAVGDCETYDTLGGFAGNSTGGTGWNHFALFQLADGNYVVGFTGQNGVFGEYHGDYQDVVVELVAIPEPGTVAIMGLGLAALGLLGRRRFVKK
jgi:PEP-CTERM motif